MTELNSTAVEYNQDLFLRISVVASAVKPGTVVKTVEDLAKIPNCVLEAWILSLLQCTIGSNFSMTTTNSFGEFDTTTQVWDGVIGSFLNDTADFGISSYLITPARYEVVDYSYSLGTLPDFMAFYRRPSFAHDSWALTRPFHANLWLVIAVFVAITSLLFALILLSKNRGKDIRRCTSSRVSALYSGFLWSVEVLSLNAQCSSDLGKTVMILFLTLSPSAYIINEAYNGMLLSFLTVPSEPFGRFDQLMALRFKFVMDSHLQFVVEAIEARSNTKGFKKAVIQPEKTVQGLKSVKKEVLRGSFAFISIDYYGYNDLRDEFSASERASIAQLSALTGKTTQYALMLPKGSPHKRLINNQLLKAMQGGLNKLWVRRIRTRRPESSRAVLLKQPQISIVSTVVAFIVFACGFVAAVTILLCEIRLLKKY